MSDTRVYHEVENNYVLREYSEREDKLDNLTQLPRWLLLSTVSWTIHVLFPLYQGRSDQPRRYCEPLTGENDGDGEDDILMPGCTKVYYDTFKIIITWLVPIVIKHTDDNLQCIYDDIPTFVKSTAYFQIKVA